MPKETSGMAAPETVEVTDRGWFAPTKKQPEDLDAVLIEKRLEAMSAQIVEMQHKHDVELQSLTSKSDYLQRKLEDYEAPSGDNILPNDTYSFFATADYAAPLGSGGCWRPRFTFVFAFGVMAIQVLTLSLLASDVTDSANKSNSLGIPAGVELTVRISQIVAIFITAISQQEVLQSLNVWYRGYDEETNINAFGSTSRVKWHFSLVSRFVVGCLGLYVTLILILRSDEVLDLLLNFTAVSFISSVDNVVFILAKWGYIGKDVQNDSRTVASAKIPITDDPNATSVKRVGCFPRTLVFLLILSLMIAFWGIISVKQTRGDFYVCKTVFVQFGEELAPFNGLYTLEDAGASDIGGRGDYIVRYEGNFSQSSRFFYCEDESVWAFTFNGVQSDSGPCAYRAKSSATQSFDITDTASDTWFEQDSALSRALPLFSLTCQEDFFGKECGGDADCGNAMRFSCVDKKCVCKEDRFGLDCEFSLPCPSISVDARRDSFIDPVVDGWNDGNREWSTAFELLTENNTRTDLPPIQIYNRPVYVSTQRPSGSFDIVFFTGRRWALTHAQLFDGLDGGAPLSQIAKFLLNSFHAYLSNYRVVFVSAPVDADSLADAATPVNLKWFQAAESTGSSEFQLADTNKEFEVLFLCGTCSADDDCLFDGTCVNETCACGRAVTGAICEVPPIGDGVCDTFLNTPEFDYDGGDCCNTQGGSFSDGACLVPVNVRIEHGSDPLDTAWSLYCGGKLEKEFSAGDYSTEYGEIIDYPYSIATGTECNFTFENPDGIDCAGSFFSDTGCTFALSVGGIQVFDGSNFTPPQANFTFNVSLSDEGGGRKL